MLALHALLRAHGLRHQQQPDFNPEVAVADDVITTRVDIRDFVSQKRAALRVHRTQVGVEDVFLTMPDHLARVALGYEAFQRVQSWVPVPAQEHTLFSGLVECA